MNRNPRRIKLGYLLPTRENVMRGDHSAASLLEAARMARDCGFDSVWAGDSLFSRARHDPITLLAAVAAATPEVYLGTAVLLPALRNPVVLAQQLATLDQICDGRLIVGIGQAADTPPVRAEFAAAGVPFEKRIGRMLEGLNLCRALWSGEPVTWQGRWTLDQVTLGPQPFRRGGPPLWLASNVAAGVQRAGRRFDGWFPIGPTAAAVAANHRLLTTAAADAGRGVPTTAAYLTICIDDDAAAAEARIDEYLNGYYGLPAKVLRGVQACRGGSVEQVLGFLQEFVTAGADHLVLRVVGDHRHALNRLAARRAALESP
ncbi:MAG: LLM class flavin-dependent oxidoreductase [Pseudomonadales bacterium]